MAWKKINSYVQMWNKPVLGTIEQKDGKRFMALCIEQIKGGWLGIARQVYDREGSPYIIGHVDRSKLIIVESHDLVEWQIKGEINLIGIGEIISKYSREDKDFIGLEDPDIYMDDKGVIHVYFTMAYKLKRLDWYDVHIGHAFGNNIEELTATPPVIERVNNEITGFKEICILPNKKNGKYQILAETIVDRGGVKKYSAIGLMDAEDIGGKWRYIKLVHDPEKEKRKWCKGDSSPCRIFKPDILTYGKFLVGIMNGGEKIITPTGKKKYGNYLPGLFLYDPEKNEIPWIADKPLFSDPESTGITFASDLVYLNDKEVILYAHPNDSFVRAYKLNCDKLRELLPKNLF